MGETVDPLTAHSARDLTIVKHLLSSAATLTLYDYLLTLEDEIRYVWRGRKTWVAYLYILNRILLTVYQLFVIYYISSPTKSGDVCFAGYYAQVSLITVFLISSDTFITLRVYAITSKNKILAVYFGTLVLARLIVSVVISIHGHPTAVIFYEASVDAFDICEIIIDLEFMSIPSVIGTAFELSAFLVIIWYTYRNKSALNLSGLVRTIVAEATIYFLAMLALQTYIQLSLRLMKGTNQQLSFLSYGLLNPILTMRFAVSLKRSADPDGGQEWQLKHFSSVNFASRLSPDLQMSTVRDDIEMEPLDSPDDQLRTR